jgi:predicted permease
MQAILAVTVPFFALVLCGYLAAQARVLPDSAIPGLNAFVLYFALPCLLFRFGAGMPVLQLLDPLVLAVYLPVAGLMIVFTLAATRAREASLKDAAFGALVGAFPNTGFMGVPLLVALLGAQAAGPVICTVLVDLFFTSSVCIALAQARGGGRAGWKGLRGALSNPLPWAIALGVLASAAGARLPGPLDSVVRMLADAASPVALFTIGAVLWRGGQHAHSRTPWARLPTRSPGSGACSAGSRMSAPRCSSKTSAITAMPRRRHCRATHCASMSRRRPTHSRHTRQASASTRR